MIITETETAHLVLVSKGRVLNLTFGPSQVRLNPECEWAVDEITALRQAVTDLEDAARQERTAGSKGLVELMKRGSAVSKWLTR